MKKVLMVMMVLIVLMGGGIAEDEYEGCEVYFALCNPESFVNVREFPNRKQEPISVLFCGEKVYHDGKVRNGYYHIVGLSNESGDGWVSTRYIDIWEPMDDVAGMYRVIGDGRVAIREGIGGKVIGWLQPGTEVEVLAMSAKWAVINKGFVKADYLEEV